jgi:hypothetical protein
MESRFTMTPGVRKFVLTTHVTFSVGWLGAVAGFLALSIASLTSRNVEIVRGAYVSMNLLGAFLIVPLSLGSLTTGLVHSLGGKWGLFRHYWVAVKFFLNVGGTILLLLHQFTAVAEGAARASAAVGNAVLDPALRSVGRQLLIDAILAMVVLLAATVLSVYKPWGLTAYGRRKQLGGAAPDVTADDRRRSRLKTIVIAVLVLASLVTLHLVKGGHSFHGH